MGEGAVASGPTGQGRGSGWRAGAPAFALAVMLTTAFALCLPQILAGDSIVAAWDWAPALGVRLAFLIDGLSLVFALMICGIGALILLYSIGYMGHDPDFGRFVLILTGFMLSMLGLVLAADLITLFVFWELTSITSWLLIGFRNEDPVARRNALQALLVTGAGGLALLAGFILIGMAAGSHDMVALLASPGLQDDALYAPILVLILLGAFSKSAQVPFHFWLPNAMAAPTPVSAYLHSATMVKAGIYLLARFHPVLGGTPGWATALTLAGLTTAVTATVLALRQTDLKTALAYTTLMALGTITLLLAGDTPYALTAAVTFTIIHALYKAALFMVTGIIDHGTGTRDLRRLSGLGRAMPLVAVAAALAAAAMAGLPPFLGWIGKELIYAGTLQAGPAVAALMLVANAGMVALALTIALRVFWQGEPTPVRANARTGLATGWPMLAGPGVLAILGLAFGLAPGHLVAPLIESAVIGPLGQDRVAGLHLWAGVNLPLILGLATLALGGLGYAVHDRLRHKLAELLGRVPSFDRGWDLGLEGFKSFVRWQTGLIQPGRASFYLAASFSVLAALVCLTLLLRPPALSIDLSAPLLLWLIAAFVLAGAALTLTQRSRIANVAGIGAVGIGVALIFVLFAAPDVATTQLMVETLSAVLFGIALLRLPAITDRRSPARRLIHAGIALAVGLGMTLTILAVIAHPLDRHITAFFETNSYLLAHGRNIVNVILVDFRAFDTFGELSVVVLAAIGAFAVLRRRSGRAASGGQGE